MFSRSALRFAGAIWVPALAYGLVRGYSLFDSAAAAVLLVGLVVVVGGLGCLLSRR